MKLILLPLCLWTVQVVQCFQQHGAARSAAGPAFISRNIMPSIPQASYHASTILHSSVGGNDAPNGRDEDGDDELNKFLTPKEESENLRKAREYMSESSLPLSYSEDDQDIDDTEDDEDEDDDDDDSSLVYSGSNSNNAASNSALFGQKEIPNDVLAKNPYLQVVSKLTPSEMISRFTATSHPRVQEAVRTTILGLIGNLPKMAFDTTTITTGQRLASLMFQLQMTGYMFKNAEYRLSLSQSLGMSASVYRSQSSNLLLTGSDDGYDDDDESEEDPLLSGKVHGKLKVRYGSSTKEEDDAATASGMEMEVDAAAYMSELRSEVSRLKEELSITQKAKEDALRKDLLLYIRTLPKKELQSLTNTMSPDVLVSMKGLIQVVLKGIGDGKLAPDTVTEQSGEAMAQLCMWQLVLGYNLRELEVREEMKKSMSTIMGSNSESGADLDEPGALE